MARNNGIPRATGEYIAFLDSDDYLPLDTYEELYNATENGRVDIVGGQLEYEHHNNNEIQKHLIMSNFFPNNEFEVVIDPKFDRCYWDIFRYSSVCYKIYRTEFIIDHKLGFPKDLYFEDIPFTVIANILVSKMKIIRKKVYNYYQRKDSIMRQTDKRKLLDFFKILEVTYNMIDEYNIGEYKYIFDYIVLENHLPHLNRLNHVIERTGIEQYSLTIAEFEYVSSVLKNTLVGVSLETLSNLETEKRNVYLELLNNLDDENSTIENKETSQELLLAKQEIERIHNMRSWKLVMKHQNIMNRKFGRLLRKMLRL